MKKISKYFLIATTFIMANVPAFAAENEAVCKLIKELRPVISVLRTLAFVGAAFVLMDMAWGWIKKPDDLSKDKLKDIGIGMFVGFFLLFGVGIILQFVGSTKGAGYFNCVADALNP